MKLNYLILALALLMLVAADEFIVGSKPKHAQKSGHLDQLDKSKSLKNDDDSAKPSKDKSSSFLKIRKLPPKKERDQDNIYEFVDHAIKQKYWYYLTKACLLYLTSVDQGKNTFQFLGIYRNIVGTFLAITTWTKGESSFQVNTLVRLGDGDGRKLGANYKPIAVRPLKLRYSLGKNEMVIDFTDSWDIKVNGKCIECHEDDNDDHDLCVKECRELNEEVRKKFWFYLEKSKVVYSNVAKTAQRNYCLITYLNEVGTFLVAGSNKKHESGSNNHVNTFVRLGNGCASGVQYKHTPFNKVRLPLADFQE